jgi:integrase
MPRVATKLTPTKSGGWFARKRIPEDVQDAYEKLYGVRWEERLALPPISSAKARASHRDWLNEIEARIANIRAGQRGDGQTLTSMQTRALSGEWYHWYLERHQARHQSAEHWEFFRDQINEELTDAINLYRDPHDPERQEIDDVWRGEPEAREEIRPMLADWGETAQFLAARRLVLDNASRDLFLDALYGDFGEALKLLIRQAHGDYSPDTRPRQFPKFETAERTGLTPWQLFERWVEAKSPADATVDRWRGVFLKLEKDFGSRSAASITVEDAQEWVAGLVGAERTARTVKDVWLVAARTVFGEAVKLKLLVRNVFMEVHLPVPRSSVARETKAFRPEEAKIILRASLAVTKTNRASDAVRRWVPWICAYTGARSGEITQLRGVDVIKQDGIDAIRITPEAGTVKTKQARLVPLHSHLIKQGFLSFVSRKGKGPLFYNPPSQPSKSGSATNPSKARSVKARERVAQWVREQGIDDPNVKPNHAWRHTFKQIAERNGISERVSDYITGHAPATVSRGYGAPTLKDMAEALKKFPRYDLSGTAKTVDRQSKLAAHA